MPPDRHLLVDGARLRYRDEGAGPAVLLIHGWALDLDVWEPQAAVLASQFRVLRFDRRGFGLSSGAPSLERDVQDAAALLDALHVGCAALVGASQGARIALRLALAAPERCTALVLDGPPDEVGGGRGALAADVPIDEYRQLARRGDLSGVRQRWSEHPFTRLVAEDPAAAGLLAAVLARYPGADLLEDAAPPAPIGDASALRVPVLVINGELDLESRRAAGSALAAALPAAAQHVVAGAGHLPNLDAPTAYNGALQRFLSASLAAAASRP